jgi:hypothetical protein
MTSLSRELVFLILQFLDEEKFKETVHKWAAPFFLTSLLLSPPATAVGGRLARSSLPALSRI